MAKKVIKVEDINFNKAEVKEEFERLTSWFISEDDQKKLIKYIYQLGLKVKEAKIGESRSKKKRRPILLIYTENLNKDLVMLMMEEYGEELYQLSRCINKGWQEVNTWG